MWLLVLVILATGEEMNYKDKFATEADCEKQRVVSIAKLQKDNPTVNMANEVVLACKKVR